MEISSISVSSELGLMEDQSIINQWYMNSIDELIFPQLTYAYGDHYNDMINPQQQTFNNKVMTSMDTICRPTKQPKLNPVFCFNQQAPALITPALIDSSNKNYTGIVKPEEEQTGQVCSPNTLASHVNQDFVLKACQGNKRISTSNPTRFNHSQDHILAERKRREKLSQRFIALSSIIPGLKKMDKASVLAEAIKYLKQLQDRVKALEEQTRKKTMDSAVIIKKSRVVADESEKSCSGDGFSQDSFDLSLPEIEARFCEQNVLIRVHCEKRKGILEKTLCEVEKLNLTVVNTSVLSFGSSSLDITIIAQKNNEFKMSVKDLVKKLKSTFELFM